ncbi:hypothetical protein F4804DRAFT_331007 [Jackrogersella minutella]|nr:hypothetical protein F4804DRAFT_331007 [Jackrogersella minutella]
MDQQSTDNKMQKTGEDKEPISMLNRTNTEGSPASVSRRNGRLQKVPPKLRRSETRLSEELLLSMVRDSMEVEVSHTRHSDNNPNSRTSFLRQNGSPITRLHSLNGFTNTQSEPSLPSGSNIKTTATDFQWKHRGIISLGDIIDPEAQSRVQHVIIRCELDDIKLTPQEAYDALRMAEGSVDEAVKLIKRDSWRSSSKPAKEEKGEVHIGLVGDYISLIEGRMRWREIGLIY